GAGPRAARCAGRGPAARRRRWAGGGPAGGRAGGSRPGGQHDAPIRRSCLVSHPHPGLTAPPALPKRGLRIIGLGGLGEIGRNMTVFEYAGRLLIVDCGVLFPEPDQPGVDLTLPDFSYLDGRLGQVEAVVLTHAHEDHIGGIPSLLRERPDLTLVGSKLPLGLVRSKLIEHRLTPSPVEAAAGTRQSFGPFGLE